MVLIKAHEDSWVSITADGKQIMQDTLSAPAEKSIEARNQIVIKTGNAGCTGYLVQWKEAGRCKAVITR